MLISLLAIVARFKKKRSLQYQVCHKSCYIKAALARFSCSVLEFCHCICEDLTTWHFAAKYALVKFVKTSMSRNFSFESVDLISFLTVTALATLPEETTAEMQMNATLYTQWKETNAQANSAVSKDFMFRKTCIIIFPWRTIYRKSWATEWNLIFSAKHWKCCSGFHAWPVFTLDLFLKTFPSLQHL